MPISDCSNAGSYTGASTHFILCSETILLRIVEKFWMASAMSRYSRAARQLFRSSSIMVNLELEETPLTGIQVGLAGNIRSHGVPFIVPVDTRPCANAVAQHQSDISSKCLAGRIF
jgi:hypothetical protein